MVHSSLSSMGHLDGGADTAVESFLDVIGSSGTLVVPTFTPAISQIRELTQFSIL